MIIVSLHKVLFWHVFLMQIYMHDELDYPISPSGPTETILLGPAQLPFNKRNRKFGGNIHRRSVL